MAHPYAQNSSDRMRAKAICKADGGGVDPTTGGIVKTPSLRSGNVGGPGGGGVAAFPKSLKDADSNRMRFERGIDNVSKKYNMHPDELRTRMKDEYSAPVLRGPGAAEKSGGRVE